MSYLLARTKEEKSRRRAVIVSAAKELFYKNGYRVGLDEIAAKAKLSRATLYLYFKNKDELYVAAMLEGFHGAEAAFMKASKSGRGVEDKIKRFYYAWLDYMLENREFFRITQHYLAEDFAARISLDPTQLVDKEIARLLPHLADLIQEGIEQGVFKEGLNALHLATILWRTWTGLMDVAIAEECKDPRTGRWGEIFDLAITVALDGTRSTKKGIRSPKRSKRKPPKRAVTGSAHPS